MTQALDLIRQLPPGLQFALYLIAGAGVCWLAARGMDRAYGRPPR